MNGILEALTEVAISNIITTVASVVETMMLEIV